MNPLEIIQKYYSVNSEAYKILVKHSRDVADKAVFIGRMHPAMQLDLQFIEEAAMLHDIGAFLCNAPEIGCYGKAEYICHGYLGADLLRKEGYPLHALVCERHTGTGISVELNIRYNLPLPRRDMRPQTMEEQLICYSDKFFSKTRLYREKPVEKILKSMAKYGEESVLQFVKWHQLFGLKVS
jgi:uncharacterized protein